ncbi:MAG: hypothetical protein K8F59_10550 [Rhodobacteraceae bacterium]|nr:hypothetical protein [Paracoccaceae bacterium]
MAVVYHQGGFPPPDLNWPDLFPLIGPANSVRALDWFFCRPIFVATEYVGRSDIPESTAKRILRLVRDNGLLREIRPSSGRRPAVLAFPELLNICEGRAAF